MMERGDVVEYFPWTRGIVKLYYMALAIQSAGCIVALTLTAQWFDSVPLILATGYLVDLLFVAAALRVMPTLRTTRTLLAAGVVVVGALALGVVNFHFTRSLVTESLLYGLFLVKIVIFGSLFREREHRELFVRFLGMYTVVTVLFTVLGICILTAMASALPGIYFNLTPQLLFPFIWSMSSGAQPLGMFILLLGMLTGKRMILLGILLALALGFRRWVWNDLRGMASLGLLVGVGILASGFVMEYAPGIRKSVATGASIQSAFTDDHSGSDVAESAFDGEEQIGPLGRILRRIDRHRYYDARSAVAGMTPLEMVVGRGFGYRYEWMHVDIGVTFAVPHFTPAGLFMKFGIVGTAVWALLFGGALYAGWRRKGEPLAFACLVFLACLAVQSLFAYVLFANPLTAIAIGYLFARKPGEASGREGPTCALHPPGGMR